MNVGAGTLRIWILAALVAGGCGIGPTTPTSSMAAARAELRGMIEDVTAADAFRYTLTDDLGRSMGPSKVIAIPEIDGFGAVYFTWADADAAFHVQLATSPDLLEWTWRVELASQASQPAIARTPEGAYVVAWEQEPDPIHLTIASYATWEDLLAARTDRRLDPPVTTPACGEGTPSIEAADAAHVALGFHYHGDCERDRQAGGSTDWSTWTSATRRGIDDALIAQGVDGHIGDRDTIRWRGNDLMLIEGQLRLDEVTSWRTFLYDPWTGIAEQLAFRTHDGSLAFSNPTITAVDVDGAPALVVTLYVISEAAADGEGEELLYYRFIPDD